MTYLSERYLESVATLQEAELMRSQYVTTFKSATSTTIFLSHSHRDSTIVEGFIRLLAYSQVSVYVDWQDTMMPERTNIETAQRIKSKIQEMDYFIVLATNNALQSRWVPWEIGFADATKSIDKIAIIPVLDYSGRFYGNEYLQLYRNIQMGQLRLTNQNILSVFEPNTDTGLTVKSWLE